MGTMLQAAGLAPGACPEQFNLHAPDKLCDIQRAYVEAGADILLTNTFGTNARKLQGTGISVAQAVSAGIACARRAADGRALVALDIGPLGELLEPNGTLTFEQAYDLFAEVVRAGRGADLVLIETMADLYEVKAAVLAALECCDLPVLASMTFERQGRSFAGVPVEGFATAIGALPVAGLGINCSLGPAEVMPLLQRLCAATELPVFAMPNAGLPNPVTGAHDLSPEAFCAAMAPCLDMGVAAVGGCCGTTPATIALLSKQFKDKKPAPRRPALPARVCGSTHVAEVSRPLAVGERINPTGKKRLREALQVGDLSPVQTLAVEQQQAGAEILDVNVGTPGVDEVRLLPRAVKAVQAVSGLPLQIDSSDPAALEAALRVCCGKPIVNSTSAEEGRLQAILPLCRRYGAAVVGLTLDEASVPERAEARVALAQKIVDRALAAGLPKRDLYIDCLTLSVGAQPEAAAETLRALRTVKQQLGVGTVLGVSNVSFGLPDRPLLNRTFLAMALEAGLDLAIVNPSDEELMDTLSAHRLLAGHEGAADAYVARRGGQAARPQAPADKTQGLPLDLAIERGLRAEAAEAARALLQDPGADPLALVNDYLIPALDRVGEGFEQKTVFLPQLLMAAGAAQAAFEVIRAGMGAAGLPTGPTVVVATVQGDIHDIGKNIAKALLENYGFAVIDLGRDVPPEAVVEAAEQNGAALVGLSALMTTTLPAMERTIALLRRRLPDCRILVGGAVLNEAYARQIGADFFARDAKASADYARSLTK
ncbi:MAG: dihydropteroate synthase [Clostridiales bacterium]|nr:dihydropteroate synthase [Clostridiales bacterium]